MKDKRLFVYRSTAFSTAFVTSSEAIVHNVVQGIGTPTISLYKGSSSNLADILYTFNVAQDDIKTLNIPVTAGFTVVQGGSSAGTILITWSKP